MLVCGTIRAQMNDVHNEIATARTIAPQGRNDSNVTYVIHITKLDVSSVVPSRAEALTIRVVLGLHRDSCRMTSSVAARLWPAEGRTSSVAARLL